MQVSQNAKKKLEWRAFFVYFVLLGLIVLLLGVIQGIIRVIGGVHFIKDVVCGALVGIGFGLLAYGIILPILSS